MRRTTILLLLLTSLLLPRSVVAGEDLLPQRPEMITPQAQASIERGLRYLAREQRRDGSFLGDRGGKYPVVMTSLAGLALMAGGNTPHEGPYARTVQRAVEYVLRNAHRNGYISNMSQAQRGMYGHGFGMLFLAQAYGMETDERQRQEIGEALRRAVHLTGRSQSRDGGWNYTPEMNSDEGSVTVTQIQGLRACRNAGIHVPKEIIEKACAYIQKCANKDGGIAYSLRSRGRSLPAITAAAVAVMYNAGEYENPVALGALEYTKKQIAQARASNRRQSGHQFYSRLYIGQAMWLSSADDWNSYFPRERDDLIGSQRTDGSWNGDHVGTVYGTSIALLTLQLPYQYLPILQR